MKQQILVDIAVLSLIVFLFFAMSKGRRDKRLNLWTAGWIFIVGQFAAELWNPLAPGPQKLQACISVDALLLAASCFIISHAMLRIAKHLTQRYAASLIPLTLIVVNCAICGWPSPSLLVAIIVLRQGFAIWLHYRSRRQLRFGESSIFINLILSSWMIWSVLHGRPEIVVYGLLCQVYLSTAINFYAYGWRSSAAVKTMIAGFVAWAAVWPTAELIANIYPTVVIDPEVWNVPKFFVAIGMILAVIEEDSRTARALGEDYRLIFDDSPLPLWILDAKSLRFLAANQAALDLHGYTRTEFLAMDLWTLLPADTHEQARQVVHDPVHTSFKARRHRCKDGSEVLLDVQTQEIVFQGRQCRMAHAVNVTERVRLEKQLEHQSTHDTLTGLPNRKLLLDRLQLALDEAVGGGGKVAVLSLDLDHFKRLNDSYGFAVGDGYLEYIAGLLTSRARSIDIVARTGGDEFSIVLTKLKSPVPVEQEIRNLMLLFGEPLVLQGYKIRVPISIGVAVGPDNGTDAMTLWRGVESALNEAKASGAGSTVWLSAELRKAAEQESRLATHLRANIHDGGLYLAYQPIYGIDGAMSGMEALLRYHHREFGQVSPSTLIPIAESSGFIIPLGEWVIEEVCRQMLVWRSQDLPLVPVSINISGLQLIHEDFADRLIGTLNRYGVDSTLIHLEITESVAVRDVELIMEKIEYLRSMGLEFSIDDFGTGHSSFARFSQLGVAVLKIDKSFLLSDSLQNSHSVVQAIVTMAHALNHRVVAEGVETEAQLDCLRAMGCDHYQGYLLSRPVPPEQIPALLRVSSPAFVREHLGKMEFLRLVQGTGG